MNYTDKNRVQAVCDNGHPHMWWGGPFMAERGSGYVQIWGAPLYCHCGARVKAQD